MWTNRGLTRKTTDGIAVMKIRTWLKLKMHCASMIAITITYMSYILFFPIAQAMDNDFSKAKAFLAYPELPRLETGEPVKVYIGLRLNKIYGVDTLNETFKADGYRIMEWKDLGVASLFKGVQGEEMIFRGTSMVDMIANHIWHPVIEFVNNAEDISLPHTVLTVRKNGWIRLKERFYGQFSSDMDFRKYPFDTQKIKIHIEPFADGRDDIVFIPLESNHAMLKSGSLNEWQVKASVGTISDSKSPGFKSPAVLEGETTYSRYSLEIWISRLSGYFIWQVFLPLFLILASSWVVFWLKEFGQQLSTAFTLMLTVVAFNFYTSSLLPRLAYNTFIEVVIISGYGVIFMAILFIVSCQVIQRKGHEVVAHRFFSICRWLFPLSYFVSFLLISGWFLI